MYRKYDASSDIDEGTMVDVKIGIMKDGVVRHKRMGRDLGRERELVEVWATSKMKIPSFKRISDPKAYLEWEKKIELIFDYYNYSKEKPYLNLLIKLLLGGIK